MSSMTVGALAAQRPQSVKVLQRHRIDFCCGGGQALDAACAAKGLEVDALLGEVAVEESRTNTPDARWDEAPLGQLVGHLLERHHAPLEVELPRLDGLVRKVARVHHERDPEGFDRLVALWEDLRDDLEPHMMKEERILFPAILAGRGRDVGGPVSVMHADHEHLGGILAGLREVTHDYTPPADGCGSWRALFQGLSDLEADLKLHIHLENNVLFPRALTGEAV